MRFDVLKQLVDTHFGNIASIEHFDLWVCLFTRQSGRLGTRRTVGHGRYQAAEVQGRYGLQGGFWRSRRFGREDGFLRLDVLAE